MKKIILSITCLAFMFNVNAQLLESYTQESWLNDDWQLTFRYLYYYDAAENNIQTDFNLRDVANSAWNDNYKDTVYFDANGRRDSIIASLYNSTTSQWEVYSISTYEYDPEGDILAFLVENYIDGFRVPSTLTSYSYDNNGFQIQTVYSNWDAQNDSWAQSYKAEQTPNTEGLVDTLTSYLYSIDLQDWTGYQRIGHLYNNSGKVSETNTEGFISGAWINSSRNYYQYDASDNLEFERSEAWQSSSGTWLYNFKVDYTNTSFNKVETMLSQFYDTNDSTWTNSQRGNYVYAGSSSIEKQKDLSVNVFPNPTRNTIQFNVNEEFVAQVYDINGRLVISEHYNSTNKKLSVEALPNGLYVVNLIGAKGIKHAKFVKVD